MKKIYAILVLGLFAFTPSNLFNNTLQAPPFSQDWSNIGLITANDDWSSVPGIVGFLGQDLTTVTGTDPQTLLGVSAIANDLDVIANQTAPNTLTNGGVGEFHITDPTIALQGSGTADAPNIIIYLNTTGQQNINVAYNVRDIDGSVDNAIQAVALQYRVGNTGNFTNIPAGFVPDATTQNAATQVTAVSAVLPAAANNQPEVQVRVITTNAAGNDEWVGVDDINITGSPLSGNSSNSDIIANGSFIPTANINYLTYQAADITDANSVEVAQFTIQDGGGAADGDAVATILTNLSMSLSNSANIRRVALYDGITELAEVAGGATVNFGALTLTAPDDGSKIFSVRVTFNTAVTDNQQFLFTITSATADVAGSNFTAANAGGATSSVAGDDNRIEVTADRLAYVQNTTTPTGLNVAMTPAVTLRANDINANLDLDFVGSISMTSTGTLVGSPVIVPAVAGVVTFSTLTHSVVGTGLIMTAERDGTADWDIASNPFDIGVASSNTDFFRSVTTGNWGTAATWETSATGLPGSWTPSTLIPDAFANTITIQSPHVVTVAAAAGGDQIVVDAGGTLTLAAAFTLADGAGADLTVDGTVINTAGTHVFTGAGAFNAGSLYQHNRNGGAAPTAAWNITSLFEVTGATTTQPSNITQNFGNFTWNSALTASTNLVGTLTTIAGNFRVQNTGTAELRLTTTAILNLTVGGNFIVEDDFNMDNNVGGTTTVTIGGNFTHTGGTFQSSAGVVSITMTGVGRTFTQSGGTFNGTNLNWIISAGAIVTLANNLPVSTTRSLSVAGTLDANTLQITGAGDVSVSGTLRTSHADGLELTGTFANTGTKILGVASTIDYYAGVGQIFSARADYASVLVTGGNKTLNGNAIMSGELGLSSGIVISTSTNLLSLTNTAFVSGASHISFVNGPIRKAGNTAFIFPVGKIGTGYIPIEVSNFTGTLDPVNDAFTAEYMRGDANALGPIIGTALVDHVSHCDYWILDRTSGVQVVDVTAYWESAINTCGGAPYVTDLSTLQLVHFSNIIPGWDLSSNGFKSTAGTVASGSITWASVAIFSPFALASVDVTNPLPITINYFNGYKQNADHALHWKVTCTSTPSATMVMERSTDGRNYSSIYSITATALQCQSPFNYTDAQPAAGVNYYRLKMTDANGKVTYSGVVSLINAIKGFDIMNIAPNPIVSGRFNLNVSAAQKAQMNVVVTDMQGRVMQQQTISLIAGFNAIPMNVTKFSAGTYQVYGVTEDGRSKVLRFVIQ